MNDSNNPKPAGGAAFDSPGLLPGGVQFWETGMPVWFGARATGAYRISGGVLLQIPYLLAPSGCLPFSALFQRVPLDRVSSGTLQLGDWLEDECECELPVELLLGPDGKVWAQVGAVEDLSLRGLDTRERHARRILAEFLEAYAEWVNEQDGAHPPPDILRAWPPWRLASWLSRTVSSAPGPMGALMNGVLGELEALGFRTRPAAQEAAHPPEYDSQTGGHDLAPAFPPALQGGSHP